MKRIKVMICSIVIVMSVVFLSTAASAVSSAAKLEKKVFRLHVIGASNSVEDQMLKLRVRDEILKESEILFSGVKNADEAKKKAEENITKFYETATAALKNNQSDYSCSVSVENRFFPTKEYENNVILPAGDYDALVVKIGEAKGENWWCVMFPQICLSGTINASMNDVLEDEELELTKKPETKSAKIKFKTVEIFNMISESIKEIIGS